MTIACYLEPDRPKAHFWMRSFAQGCQGKVIVTGKRDPDAKDHAVMGNWPVATTLIGELAGAPFWYMDSSYIHGTRQRHIRVERGRFWPVLEPRKMLRAERMGARLQPWRHDGKHVLFCLHGRKFGMPWGIDIAEWQERAEATIRAATDRPIVIRPKLMKQPVALADDLADAWCLVTHSSTAAVTAAMLGVPVFCEPTCAAAAVGCTDLSQIERPVRPDREGWIASLAWHQWSVDELRSGVAWKHLSGMA